MKKLNIGDKLYRYVSLKGVFEYEVVGIRQYEKNNHYELICKNCNHGQQCKVLVNADPVYKKAFKYIEMLNNDDIDDDVHSFSWHYDGNYFLSSEEALIYKSEKHLQWLKNILEDAENRVKRIKEETQESEDYIKSLVLKLKEKGDA